MKPQHGLRWVRQSSPEEIDRALRNGELSDLLTGREVEEDVNPLVGRCARGCSCATDRRPTRPIVLGESHGRLGHVGWRAEGPHG